MRWKGKICLWALALSAALLAGGCGASGSRAAYQAGCAALKDGDPEKAEAHFKEMLNGRYFLSEAYRGIGLSQMARASYADACISFEKSLLEADGESDEYIRDVSLYLAYCRERQGQRAEAEEIYDGIIRKNPDPEALFLRGRLSLRAGDSKAARNDFDQAVSLKADYDLYINIYEVYEEEDKSGDGSYFLEQALREASRNEEDFYNQGLVNYYLQNYDEARDMLIRAVKRDETDSRAVFLLGKVYLASGDTANARAVFNEYTGKEGTAAGAYNGMALCEIADGNYEEALRNVEAGLALGDSSAEQGLYFNEIVIYEKMHDWQTARSKAAAYVGRYPTDEAGAREYEFLSTR